MPLSSYLIRNEFKLADSKLYAESDKNDPGALLDGVAVAGYVGLLRQLGDLAQFAAEMFHNLHQDVMATAARGQGMMDRIHNLETHVSSVEMTLLSKTDHTDFYYNAGVLWQSELRMDEYIVTREEVPRFIRDYCEECHAPPPLHLLDKFDNGGAGTCLKRFTDPSFFKAQQTTAEAGKLYDERNWRARKLRKKGSCWRNGDSSEVLTASRAKLHQLLHEDRAKGDGKVLKRRISFKIMNLDNSRSRKSYMQEFLQSISPEHLEAPETEVGQVLGSVAEDSIYIPYTDPESKPLTSFTNSYGFDNRQGNKNFRSRVYGSNIGEGLVVSGENKHKNGIRHSHSSSEDIGSAIECDTDALADVESEIESDKRYRPSYGNGLKKEHLYSMSKQGGICPSKEHEQIHRDQFLDFQSVDKSNTSDNDSGSFIQEASPSSLHGVFPYNKHGTAMEHSSVEAMPFPSTETSVEGDTHSNPLAPAFNIRSSFGEISDGFNNAMSNPQKTYGSYWADAAASALHGLNLGSVGPLSTKNQDHTGTYSLSGYQDTEGHVRSNNLSRERNPTDDRAVKDNFDSKYEYSHSRNWGSGQISISVSDQQEVGSQCSSSISPRYLVDPSSSCEMNKNEEFRRPQEVSFKQYDQDIKALDDNHGQLSERLHLDTIIDSTTLLRTSDWNSELTDHSSRSINALSRTHSSKESPVHLEEAFLKSEFHYGQISITEEASQADSPSLDKNLKFERGEVALERPHDSDSGRESGDLFMGSNISSPSNASGVKAGFDGKLEKLQETQAGEVSLLTSIEDPGGFPFTADSTLLVDNTVDMNNQHTHLISEEVKTDSSTIHPKTFLEAGQSDTLACAIETQQQYSSLPISVTAADDIMIDSGYNIQVPVRLVGDTTACTKETIQPKPAADIFTRTRETTQPNSHSTKPLLEDTVCEFNASDVLMRSKDQSLEDSKLQHKCENEAQSPEEKIIQCVEMHGSQTTNEEHCNQKINSSEQEAIWSRGLPNHEDEIPVAKQTAKLQRPRNSLIESVGRSTNKLKKVTSRNRPEIPCVESVNALDKSKSKKAMPYSLRDTPNNIGRNSILEVIRTKSFNLKPAAASVPKPIMRAPTMNIKVSAILEKANRIRQATTGSDEDDEWSD